MAERPSLLARSWFLIALTAIVPAGIVFPEGGAMLRRAGLVLPALTASALFISGLSLETSHLRFPAAHARGVGFGLVSVFAVAPALAWGLALLIGPPVTGAGSEGYLFLEAVMIAAAQAGTIASAPALTLIAGGNQALALLLTISSNVLTVFVTPLVLEISLGTIVAFPMVEMMTRMTWIVLVPIVFGQIVRRLVWHRIRGVLPALRIASQSIILVFVYTGVCAAAGQPSTNPGAILRFFVAAAALHGLLLAWVWKGSEVIGLDPRSRTALVFCGTQKTLPNGIYLWDRFFSSNPHGALAIVQYHVLQLVVDTFLVSPLRKKIADDR